MKESQPPVESRLREILKQVPCYCTSCQPPYEKLQVDRALFLDLIISGDPPAESQNERDILNLGTDTAYRADELRLFDVSNLAEDLAVLPINEACARIQKLAEVVRDAGEIAGFYGPVATDRILNAPNRKQNPRRQSRIGSN